MSFESQSTSHIESPESRAEQYYQEALKIAQRISQRWQKLREEKKENSNLLSSSPNLEEIDLMTKPPVTGIQAWLESRVKFIDRQAGSAEGPENAEARSRMMYQLKEDLEHIEQQVDQLID